MIRELFPSPCIQTIVSTAWLLLVWLNLSMSFLSIDAMAQTASWTLPTPISTAALSSKKPHVTLSSNGTVAVAIWSRSDGDDYVIRTRAATISGNSTNWGVTDFVSVAGQDAEDSQIAISSDGTKATAIWYRSNGTHEIVQSASATISGNSLSWGPITNLSANGQNASAAQIVLSSDGTQAAAVWYRNNGSNWIIQSATASISGNTANWSAATDLSVEGQDTFTPQLALSSDGTKAAAIWGRSNGSNSIIQSSSAIISGNTASWSSVVDLSASGQNANDPQIALSSDGTKAVAVWSRSNGSEYVIQFALAGIIGNIASWGAVTDLTAAGLNAISPRIAISSDGTKTTAMWCRSNGSGYVTQATSATIANDTVVWDKRISNLSTAQGTTGFPDLALSADGTGATAVWRRMTSNNHVVEAASAQISGNSATWGEATDLSGSGWSAYDPDVAISSAGTQAIAVWRRFTSEEPIIESSTASVEYMTPTPSPTPEDSNPPTVKARKSYGTIGKKLKLRYELFDDSGQSSETIRILNGVKTLNTTTVPLSVIPANGIRSKSIKTPLKKPGKLRFCVTASDAVGNASAKSCAAAIIRSP